MARRSASIVAVLSALIAVGCGTPEKPNVLLIGIDTLRADHVGAYGYPRPTTPRIDALCRESAQFEMPISQSPWTLPAFASILTGLLPSSHHAGEGSMPNFTRLPPEPETLGEALGQAGYRTASFVSNGYVSAAVGMDRGFQKSVLGPGGFVSAEEAVRGGIEWLRGHAEDRFFLFIHIIDPHQPYAPSPEDAAPFIDAAYQGPVGMSFGGFPDPRWTKADRQRVTDLYDGDVRHSDGYVGRILATLADLGLTDRTLIVLTADHGEELLDHGGLGHGKTQYDEVLHVPLCVRFPHGRYRGRIPEQVRTMDVFPTVLEAVGLPVPKDLDAVSLMPLVRNEPPPPKTALALSEFFYPAPERKAARTATHKLILTPSTGEMQLFDLRTDPHERFDRSRVEPAVAVTLRAAIEERMQAALDGFHLVARGTLGSRHRVEIELTSPSALRDVGLYAADAADSYSLSDDGRRLDVQMNLTAARVAGLEDQDGIRFRTTGDAPVTLRLVIDGVAHPPGALRLGGSDVRVTQVGPVRASDPRVVVPFLTPPPAPEDSTPAVRLSYVHHPTAVVPKLDEKTRDNLRAIGYLQ